MLGKREIAALIAVSVVGLVVFVVLGYIVYDTLTAPRPTPAIATPAPAAAYTPGPSPTPTSTPIPVPPAPTTIPAAATAQATSCVDGMRLVQHLSYDPQSPDAPHTFRTNRQFTKSWRIQNTGTCLWDPGYSLVFVSGNHPAAHMHGAEVVTHGRTLPSETYDVEIRLIAPREPGLYQGYWQMRSASGTYFGDRLPVVISVVAPLPPTPQPTWTPYPETTIQFSLDRGRIVGGECALFTWNITNAQATYFYREGQEWQAHGVPFVGQRQECPLQTTTYSLRVVRLRGWVDVRNLTVHVVQPPEPPQITQFTVEPTVVLVGTCVNLRWEVRGQDTRARLLRDGGVRWDSAPLIGSLYDCPPGTGQIVYLLEATSPGGTTYLQRVVQVNPAPTPSPSPLAGTAWQVLAIGNSIPAGPAVTAPFGQQDADGRGTLSGWGSCNTYSAPYQQSGALLTIGAPTTGNNVCTPELVAQEQALFDAFQAVASFTWGDGQLVLKNSVGEVVLNLAAFQPSAP